MRASLLALFNTAPRPRIPVSYSLPKPFLTARYATMVHTVPKVSQSGFKVCETPGSHLLLQLKDSSLFIEKCYVNGEFIDASSGATFEVHDPSTGKLIGTCPEFDTKDTQKAIAAAAEAFKTFRRTTARERATMLRNWFNLMNENAQDIATLITWENGKP